MIQVGDIVRVKGSDPELDDCDVGVCTYYKDGIFFVMWSDGSCGQEIIDDWEPTGQHTNFVNSLLSRVSELIEKSQDPMDQAWEAVRKRILKEGD